DRRPRLPRDAEDRVAQARRARRSARTHGGFGGRSPLTFRFLIRRSRRQGAAPPEPPALTRTSTTAWTTPGLCVFTTRASATSQVPPAAEQAARTCPSISSFHDSACAVLW